VRDILRVTDQEATEELDALLREAVRMRMVADVPLGAFLSGGIDSSTVVSLMQTQSNMRVKTFTIGFYEDGYNEAQYAKKVAAHLGTDHTELYLTPDQIFEVIPKIPCLYDEPFSDSSQIPTYLVSALARQHVTVSLSGDGGDELFGGYDRYFLGKSIWDTVRWLPYPVRLSLARALRRVTPEKWSHVLDFVKPLFPSGFRKELRGDRVHKLAQMVAVRYPEEFYRQLLSCWKSPAELVLGAKEPTTTLSDRNQWATLSSFPQRMMFLDLMTYLPDDILTKVDRASMGVSLEARVPLLDHRVVEFAARIPLNMKIRSGKGKWLLREVLYRYVPKELLERRKMGFGFPLGAWLRGPLREWAEGLLDERQMLQDGYLRPQLIRKLWVDHLACNRDWGYYLWTVLMFQSWLQSWMKGQAESSYAAPQAVLQ
jgi:asparagine synthase (glutamine-hydrolysing)